jgi:hypothetical protein
MANELAGILGKEARMITVDYAPGAKDAIQRHKARVFVYVLGSSVVMQVRGGKEVTPGPGWDVLLGSGRRACRGQQWEHDRAREFS